MPRASRPPRPLWLFGSLWSLREYPTPRRAWPFPRKLAAIAAAGFDGVMAPPAPDLAERGRLKYLGITSIGSVRQIEPVINAACDLGALALGVQLADYDTSLADAVRLARRIAAVAEERGLPFAIETHRDTFTETPEKTSALLRAYRTATGKRLPLCLDHSHFAVVRHLRPGDFWERLRRPQEQLAAAAQFHLRPFNGHHCQLPVLDAGGRRTPEYRDWLEYVRSLFDYLKSRPTSDPVLAVPELGHRSPAYGLSNYGDTWHDLLALTVDLRRAWSRQG